jgi:hypothetical protein
VSAVQGTAEAPEASSARSSSVAASRCPLSGTCSQPVHRRACGVWWSGRKQGKCASSDACRATREQCLDGGRLGRRRPAGRPQRRWVRLLRKPARSAPAAQGPARCCGAWPSSSACAARPSTAPAAPAWDLPYPQQTAPASQAITPGTRPGHKSTHVVTGKLRPGSLASSNDSAWHAESWPGGRLEHPPARQPAGRRGRLHPRLNRLRSDGRRSLRAAGR